jgi:hypothetical protein
MSRAHRASTAAAFAYFRFALAIVAGIVLVPFVLHHVGVRLYGYWLASGELLAYAAMADFGVLGVLPWMLAEADGRRDRDAMRRLLSTGFCAAIVVSVIYVVLVLGIWHFGSGLLALSADERAAIAGPLALMASVAAIVLPLRLATSALVGLQDVKVSGAVATAGWALDVVLTVALLLQGYGLYALALAASIPSLATAIVSAVRLRMIAPDLLSAWPRPSLAEVSRLFREGMGAWLAGWGWRLSAATDAIVLASVGTPAWITMLAMTSKLGHIMTQMAWVPGDNGLVGLANLAGEGENRRVRAAVIAIFRVYLALAAAGACAVLAVNGAFVSGWLGPGLFAGSRVNSVLAALMIVATMAHGAAAVGSVLGNRMQVGLATLASGVVQVALALFLARRLGVIGVPLAALATQALILVPALLMSMPVTAGIGATEMWRDVLVPWGGRSVPLLALCLVTGLLLPGVPLVMAIPLGGLVAAAYLWVGRHLILDYPPVASVIRARLALLRLDGLLPLAAEGPSTLPAESPRVP